MVTVTVSGPGKNISYEMELLRRFFESEGYQVTVENEYPFVAGDPQCSEFSSWEEYHAHRTHLRSEAYEQREYHNQLTLKAEHFPWGG